MDREERLIAYMQDRLSLPERDAFEAELQTDPALAAEVDVLRAVRTELAHEHEPGDAAAGWSRLSAAIDAGQPAVANENRPPRLSLWQAAAVVAAAVFLWEAAVAPSLGFLEQRGYETVSEGATSPVLQVIFKEAAPVGEIAAVLQELEGNFADGPSALGVYRLSFADSNRRDAARDMLAARKDLVEVVLEQ